MKKRTLYYLIMVLTVVIATAFFVIEKTGVRKNESRFSTLNNDSIEELISSKRENNSLSIDLQFNGIPLFYDKDAKTYYYSVPEQGTEVYDPLVSWESNNIGICFENKKIDSELISSNDSIRILIYDANRYSECKLKCTTLPLINIDKFYDAPSFTYDKSVITFYDNRNGMYESYNGQVRIRGGLTAELPKPGLRIELDKLLKGDNNTDEKYYDIFGLERDNEFVLYTCNVEKDHIRNVFSTNLWYDTCADDNSFGLKAGMFYRVCEVFMNGKYWGLCALGNPISEKRGYVDLNENSDKYLLENIYKLNFFGDRELLDYERYGNDYFFAIKTNEDKKEAWKPYTDFIHLLAESDDKDKLYNSVDLDNALDIYLFYGMIQAWDNAWYEDNLKFRNTYLISKVDDDGNIRMIYVPWDLDRSWGHCREDGLEYPMDYTFDYPMVVTPIENLLALNDGKIKKLLYEKYTQLRNNEWSDSSIFGMLDLYEKQIYGSGAFFRDKERWPENYHDDNKDLSLFKEYVKKRIAYYDEYVADTFGNDIMEKN